MRKLWDVTSSLGLHPVSWLKAVYRDTLFSFSPRRHPGVVGYVALTIDDGLCRQNAAKRSMAAEVRELLSSHGAKATFMLCSNHLKGSEEEALRLLADGHEFGNHCPADRPYASCSGADFEKELTQAGSVLAGLLEQAGSGGRVAWFRAPQAKYTSAMREVVRRHGLRHALADCYCDDFAVEDPQWIAATLLRQAGSGSIVILHMPERGHWEHTFEALRLLLEGLEARGLRAVTLSRLAELAEGTAAGELAEAPGSGISTVAAAS